MKRLGTYLLGLIIIISCSKQESIKQDRSNSSDLSTIDCSSPNNNNNTLDSAGERHNLMLDYIDNNYSEDTLTYVKLRDFIYERANALYGDNINLTDILTESEFETVIADSANNYTNIVLNTTYFSSSGKSFLIDLFNTLDSIANSANPTYCEAKTYIVDREAYLINGNNNITNDEEETLLILTSILRHSSYYWNNRSSEYMASYQNKRSHIQLPILGAILVGIADAAGGVKGYASADDDLSIAVKIAIGVASAVATSAGAVAIINFLGG